MFGSFTHLTFWLVAAVWLAAGLGGCAVSAAAPPEVAVGDTPNEVVRLFYDWYLDYARFDPERGTRNNPLVDGAYRDSRYLSPQFIRTIDEQLAGGEIRFDPFLCAQDVPNAVDMIETSLTPDAARMTIRTGLGNTFAVFVEPVNDTWQITRVDCTLESTE